MQWSSFQCSRSFFRCYRSECPFSSPSRYFQFTLIYRYSHFPLSLKKYYCVSCHPRFLTISVRDIWAGHLYTLKDYLVHCEIITGFSGLYPFVSSIASSLVVTTKSSCRHFKISPKEENWFHLKRVIVYCPSRPLNFQKLESQNWVLVHIQLFI